MKEVSICDPNYHKILWTFAPFSFMNSHVDCANCIYIYIYIYVAMHLCQASMCRLMSYLFVSEEYKMTLNLEICGSGRAHAQITNLHCYETHIWKE